MLSVAAAIPLLLSRILYISLSADATAKIEHNDLYILYQILIFLLDVLFSYSRLINETKNRFDSLYKRTHDSTPMCSTSTVMNTRIPI
jgi:hypothetical protein